MNDHLFARPHTELYEPPQDPDDLRIRHIIHMPDGEHADVGIIGIPFDYGVELSGGRPGAEHAPEAIRAQMRRYGTAYHLTRNADLTTLRMVDLGDAAVVARNSLATHENVEKAVRNALDMCGAVIILGGGNDLSYPTILALCENSLGVVGGMNVDAHFDVRPVRRGLLTSGTPYWRLLFLKHLLGKYFFEVGAQGHVNARTHYKWLERRNVSVRFLQDVRARGVAEIFDEFEEATRDCTDLFVSIDIDVVAQAFAPGSSAPSPDGLFPQDVFEIAYRAGKNKRVRLFEIMEVNPEYDVDNRTSRLAANIVLEFLAGVACRKLNYP